MGRATAVLVRMARILPRGGLALLTGLAGCATTWVPQPGPTAEVVQLSGAEDIRVTRSNGNAVVLQRAYVAGDSLIEMEKPDPTGPDIAVRRAIALADVKQVAAKEPDGPANGFWIGLGILAGTVTALVLACQGACFGND